jgi:hypothetical protein
MAASRNELIGGLGCRTGLEKSYESKSIGKKDLQELQDCAPSPDYLCHLLRRPPQAASGLIVALIG